MSSPPAAACFLFDNGSLRAESTLSLRRVAAALGERLGRPVRAVSLLHSSGVAADLLGGEPAQLLEPALAAHFTEFPEGETVLLPLFFGPSGALTEYVPARLASLRARFPKARMRLAPCLVNPHEEDRRLAEGLADRVRATLRAREWTRPKVVLVDHGSPLPEVTAVRDHLGRQMRAVLGQEIESLMVASMERREGAEYDFNEPLLARALTEAPCDRGNVVVALQFLSPGRHAGLGGDITEICAAAETARPALHIGMTEPMAGDARLIDVLVERAGQVAGVA